MKILRIISFLLFLAFCFEINAREYHVSINGNDNASGSSEAPFRTISYAAKIAQPGDTVTVHEGIYRERVNPLNGGTNDLNRIVYQAAPGKEVVIKGSEIIKNWKKYEGSVWKTVIPNSFFEDYNPYKDQLTGDWLYDSGMTHHTGEVFLNGQSLFEKSRLKDVIDSKSHADALDKEASTYTWYCEVEEDSTTIWANFKDFNPNQELVEINVRKSCFYPDKPGVNYITVRGFIMDQAATQWAAPTAEQIGLIGTHWSKGWIIENNVISNSKCVGITLGKDRSTGHNVMTQNPEKGGATHYNEVILRAREIGWSKEKIGSHIVRDNEIFHCEQAGIVGSLGGVYSEIYNNHIHDIWTKRIFDGAEIAGIKIHGSIDMLIKNNRVHNTARGIWIDWMAQGARITGNLLYDNTTEDFFSEVNHGPYLVDNNIFLSDLAIKDLSEGGAFVHNLVAGITKISKVTGRFTPYHLPHSTKVAGLRNIHCGDNRYFNNIFVKQDGEKEQIEEDRAQFYGLNGYRISGFDNKANGNMYYNGAEPYEKEVYYVKNQDFKPSFEIEEKGEQVHLKMETDSSIFEVNTSMVTTEILGATFISEAIYENPDGTPYFLNKDFSGDMRNEKNPLPGPFEKLDKGINILRVW